MSRFFTPKEAIELRLLGNRDYQKRDRMRLLSVAKYVYQDLNLNVIKQARRQYFKVDKNTNSVILPCSNLQLSSVSVVDKCGIVYPVYRNGNVKNSDIVDVAAAKDCACEFKCGYELCNTIKSYEATIETLTDKNPDGTDVSFECVSRKGVDAQGFFYEQKQYPKRIYEAGVWTETILYTEDIKMCKVEVDENGCVCDTEQNINSVCEACSIKANNSNLCCIGGDANTPPNDTCNTWIYYCNNKMDWFGTQCGCFPYMDPESNYYNISELGNRIIFPSNFGWDKVLVRWYEDLSLSEIKIPIIAIDTFIMGLMWWDKMFNDKEQALAANYGNQYATLKFGLIKELNKYRIAELQMIVAPPRYVPSYINGRTDRWEGSFGVGNYRW